MKILAYDTSSEVLSAALFDNEKKIGEIESPLFTRHSATLAPRLDILLKSHKMKMDDVGVIAVGLGPGSFTGLRVGITTAKILAYALNKKLIGVSSLEALAYGGLGNRERAIAVTLDAKKGKIYAALYNSASQKLRAVKKPALLKIEEFLAEIKTPTLFLGDGAVLYREKITGIKKAPCRILEDRAYLFPKASNVARVALRLIKEKKFTDPFNLEPVYLHPRDCNVTYA